MMQTGMNTSQLLNKLALNLKKGYRQRKSMGFFTTPSKFEE